MLEKYSRYMLGIDANRARLSSVISSERKWKKERKKERNYRASKNWLSRARSIGITSQRSLLIVSEFPLCFGVLRTMTKRLIDEEKAYVYSQLHRSAARKIRTCIMCNTYMRPCIYLSYTLGRIHMTDGIQTFFSRLTLRENVLLVVGTLR